MTIPEGFDRYASNYDQLLAKETSFFSSNDQYFASYKVDLMRKQIHEPTKFILEYGCGTGSNIRYLKHAFEESIIFGSDISAASLEVARIDNEGVEFFNEAESPEINILFDLIFVAGVFHHIPVAERLGVAKSLYKRLSPGGTIFVFEHNPYNIVTRKIVSNCPYDEGAILLKPSEMSNILIEASFYVKESKYCLFMPPAFSGLVRMEKWLGWLPLGGQYWVNAKRT